MENDKFDFGAFIEAGRRANEEAEKEKEEKDKDKTLEKAKEIILNFDKCILNIIKRNKVVYCEFALPEELFNKFYIFVKECKE